MMSTILVSYPRIVILEEFFLSTHTSIKEKEKGGHDNRFPFLSLLSRKRKREATTTSLKTAQGRGISLGRTKQLVEARTVR